MSEQLSPDEIDEIERYIPPANPDALHQPLRQVIASHRALQRELKSLTDVNNHNAFRLFGMSIEEARTLQRERDDLKRQVEEANKIIYNAKFLAKEVAEWVMQTEVEEIDLTTAEFGETWRLAKKIVAQIEKQEAP
jgi:hypothetical protein